MDTFKNTIDIPLLGVNSEHCALIIDNGIAKVDGVKSHKVDFNNEKAIVELDVKKTDLNQIIKSIRDLGYDVAAVKKTFPITGMTCASCAASSESILSMQKGVVNASVNYANTAATVEFFPSIITPQDMKAALQAVGYDMLIDESNSTDLKEEIHQNLYKELKSKTIWSVILAIPVVIIGMFFMDIAYANYIMLGLTAPVLFFFGRSFFINAFKQAKHGKANMDTLVALSTGIAFLFSTFNTLYPQFWHSKGLHAHVYFEAAAVVVAFILLGKVLEEKAKSNTSSAIKKLIGLQPKTVIIIHENNHQMEMPISQVKIGDRILVKPGDKIPVDGEVAEGNSFVDESMISGEPVPIQKTKSDNVFAGTVNQKGSFQIIAKKVGGDTVLAQIIKMVQDAQGSKAPVQKLADKIAGIFVPVVIGIALLSFGAWMVFGSENAITHALLSLVTVLVIACPCALGLATPTAIMVGVGKGAENGILIKDAESLETATKVNAVILDKTGTITQGKPQVTNELWFTEKNNITDKKQILLGMEAQSEHPLAEAVVIELKSKGIEPTHLTHVQSITGKGIRADIGGEFYIAGNKTLLDEYKVSVDPDVKQQVELWQKGARTVIYFSDSKKLLAIIAIADKIKDTSKQAIKKMQNSGIEVFMLTGDNHQTATAVAESVGISKFWSEVMPGEKASFVKQLQEKGKIVAMVGDGINDSQALAQADVSIAMGTGSDIAIDVAKMTIISSDLTAIPKAIRLSTLTVNTIKQNLFWAFIYNVIGIPIAAGLLYPINGFLLNPMLAGAAMALSSVSVVSNSLRLKTKTIQ